MPLVSPFLGIGERAVLDQNYLITVNYFILLGEFVQLFLLKQSAQSSDGFFKLNQEVLGKLVCKRLGSGLK